MQEPEYVLSVSDFVAVLNQTLEFAYPSVTVEGEVANFRVSKNRWVYFDLKDEGALVRCFGTVYQLTTQIEDGMIIRVRATPRLHQQYNFSLNVLAIQPVGEGAMKRAAQLLQAKLTAEGLFDPARKRMLPYPPQKVGLITSAQSAAYADFVKVLGARWGGIDVQLIDVQVQGENAPGNILAALEQFNEQAEPPEVLVLIRGGGSAEDLQAFSDERVTRAVASSRIPTLVAIGHEVDLSLAELAADQRASTPSNAAELLVPDKRHVLERLGQLHDSLGRQLQQRFTDIYVRLKQTREQFERVVMSNLQAAERTLILKQQLLEAYNPNLALAKGYAVVRNEHGLVRTGGDITVGQTVQVELVDAMITANVTTVNAKGRTRGKN